MMKRRPITKPQARAESSFRTGLDASSAPVSAAEYSARSTSSSPMASGVERFTSGASSLRNCLRDGSGKVVSFANN